MLNEKNMEFLKVKFGDTVLISNNEIVKVISRVGGARDPEANTLFQVANVDSGEIRFIDAAEVKAVLNDYGI